MLESIIGEDNFRNTMIEFGKMKGQVLKNNREYFEIFKRVSGRDLSWFQNQWFHWKENPVLRIQSQQETTDDNSSVKISITQEGKIFRLPLEVEIQTEKRNIRKTIWIDSAEKGFIIPLKSRVLSIKYDPDSKLFTLIKTGKRTFLSKGKIKLPAKDVVYKYKSDKDDGITKFIVNREGKGLNLVRKKDDQDLVLKITKGLTPTEFIKNGQTIYSINVKSEKINFPDTSFNISEPIYPFDFTVLLYSFIDWNIAEKESTLFLRPGRESCIISSAKVKKITNGKVKVSIDSRYNEIELYIHSGLPVKYVVDKKGIFELISI